MLRSRALHETHLAGSEDKRVLTEEEQAQMQKFIKSVLKEKARVDESESVS